MSKAVCPVCFHHCSLEEGQTGLCRARKNTGGAVTAANYGRVTALALDPIEKKPLVHFFPGTRILSLGSFGCNLRCPFCQNHSIADADEASCGGVRIMTPEDVLEEAMRTESMGNIGAAFTYNEPLTGYEFVRDTARLIKRAGLKTVLVTNGTAELPVLEELLPYTDAMNIDLKSFRAENYRKLGGSLETVLRFIRRAQKDCHVELTTLIVPGISDSPEDMEREADWIASMDPETVLHITRYFPRHKMAYPPTDIGLMRTLAAAARKSLKYVFLGNV